MCDDSNEKVVDATAPNLRRIGLLLLGSFFLFYLFTASIDTPMRSDGMDMLVDADRLVSHALGDPAEDAAYRFSKFPPGQVILNLSVVFFRRAALASKSPQARILWLLALSSLPALIGAVINVLVYCCSLRLGAATMTAVALAAMQGLCTMTWPYTQTLFSDATLGALWLAALLFLLMYRDTKKWQWLLLAGVAAGYSVMTKTSAIGPVAVLSVYAAWLGWKDVGRDPRRLLLRASAYAAPILLCIFAYLAYNQFRFGDWLNSGYGPQPENVYFRGMEQRDHLFGFNTPFYVGLWGLLFSTGKGVFWYNPVLWLVLAGIPAMWRQNRKVLMVCAGIWGTTILMHMCWWAWHGDCAWGPRFLVGTIPFALLGLSPWLDAAFAAIRSGTRRYRPALIAAAVLLVISGLVQIPGVSISYLNYLDLITHHTPVNETPLYDPVKRPVRDDCEHAHFWWRFSPIVGHTWMMRGTLGGHAAKNPDFLASPPWIGMDPAWKPSLRNSQMVFHWNVWWAFSWQMRDRLKMSPALILMLPVLLLIGALALATIAFRMASREPKAVHEGASSGPEEDGGQ